MITVDTSVWVTFLRGSDPRIVRQLDLLLEHDEALLPVPARIELLAGSPRRQEALLADLLSAVKPLSVEATSWVLIERWARAAARSGDRFGLGDLMIAATAAEASAPLWSLDGDFERMARRGWIQLYRPTA